MTQKIFNVYFLLFSTFVFSQNLKLDMLEQLTRISFASIDEYMNNAQGYYKIKEEDNGKVRIYGKQDGDNIDNTIFITVTTGFNRPLNALDITTGKNIDIQKLKNELLNSNYNYRGENFGMFIYEKNDTSFLIREKVNNMGANQILFMFK